MNIIEFKIKNFRSYKEETTFTFEALNEEFNSNNYATVELEDGESVRLLTTAAIFGANASGKSNIIWALQALSFLVANSRNFDIRTAIPVYIPFLLDEQTKEASTEMSIDFIVNKIRYRYRIRFNVIFLFEGLYIVKNGEEECVFVIDGETKPASREFTGGSGWGSTSLFLSEDILANQLFLSICGTKAANGLLEVYTALADIQAEPVGDSINLKLNNENVAGTILKNSNSKLFQQNICS